MRPSAEADVACPDAMASEHFEDANKQMHIRIRNVSRPSRLSEPSTK